MNDRWTIDICATCGKLAVYPFSCGHREPGWTIPVVVKPVYPAEYQRLFPVSDSPEG